MKKEKTYNVYLVDDDSVYLDTLEYTLQSSPYSNQLNLKTFSTGEACIKEVFTTSPDIVVLDYYLNSTSKKAMNGIKILSILKRFNRNIQVVMLSSQEKMDIAVNSLKYGASDYVIKNENAFSSIKNSINTMLCDIDVKRSSLNYQVWNIAFAILFLTALILLVVTSTGRI